MVLAAIIALLGLGWGHEKSGDTRIRVLVPADVSRAAARNLTLDTRAPGPILTLDGVEVGKGEGLTFSVLATSADPHVPPTVLAVTGLVGTSHGAPAQPLTKVIMVVPLNAHANEVVAGKTAVTLTLRLKNPARGPLRVRKATLSTAPSEN
jgi:hypothetical protein